jgi:hypothetical protein
MDKQLKFTDRQLGVIPFSQELAAEEMARWIIIRCGMEKSQALMKELELALTKRFGEMVKGEEVRNDPWAEVSPEGTT